MRTVLLPTFFNYELVLLILYIPPFGLIQSLNPPRHTFYQVLTHLRLYLIPLLLHPLPKLMNTLRRVFIVRKLLFDMSPKMFNGVQVRRLCWPYHHIIIMVRKPLGSLLAGVLGVIILLKNNISRIFPIILQASLKILIQNLLV